MKTIFSQASKRVKEGAKFNVDFKTRSIRIGKKFVIKDGKFEGELGVEPQTMEETIERLEYLYEVYKRSMPSERNTNKRRRYFLPVKEEDMLMYDMCFGANREVAQFYLEFFMLASVMNGSWKWEDNKWYWMDAHDEGLIVYKEWFE